MSAKVEILVERLEDVIIVPVQVVANQEGKKVCYCLSSNRIERRVVQTGSFNDTFVAITDGLEVGEKVLLSPPRMTEAEAEPAEPTKPTESKSESKAKDQQQPQSRGPEQKEHELTDEAIERIMGYLAKTNPEKAEELKQLRESDPEKFKAELRKLIEQFRESRRGRGDTNRGAGDARVPEKR
jgi:restriction endonuclease Mrr